MDNIYRDFELYKDFMHNFLFQNVQKFPSCILFTRRINTFWYKGIDKFWLNGISTV